MFSDVTDAARRGDDASIGGGAAAATAPAPDTANARRTKIAPPTASHTRLSAACEARPMCGLYRSK
jgi:hypothetical protein